MNKLSFVLGLLCTLFVLNVSAEVAPDSVKALASKLEVHGNNATLVSAVKAQNASGLTLAAIQDKDNKWKATSGLDAFMKSLLNNAAAKELASIEKSQPYFVELFLMDNQGANVAMTNKTGDYWQGDEAKWKVPFTGVTHISDVKFDESAQAYLVQISVPVKSADKVIGALTIGINVDELGE